VLHASPALAARFPAVIDFPGYTPAQLTAILQTLAAEAGLTLTPDAASKATTVLADAEVGHTTGNARLAVQLLTQATTNQAYRVATGPPLPDPAALAVICAADIPGTCRPRKSPPATSTCNRPRPAGTRDTRRRPPAVESPRGPRTQYRQASDSGHWGLLGDGQAQALTR
jgi:hypothetical protein